MIKYNMLGFDTRYLETQFKTEQPIIILSEDLTKEKLFPDDPIIVNYANDKDISFSISRQDMERIINEIQNEDENNKVYKKVLNKPQK